MRIFRFQTIVLAVALVACFSPAVLQQVAYCQETTGGLQGTVRDPSGAIVPGANVTLTGNTLIGSKELITDSSGYYRFANLPPGVYSLTVSAKGFKTVKRDGMNIQVGHLPTVDIPLQVGAEATTIEVTETAPLIDLTSTQNITNVSEQALQNLPTGISYQSVIQFAPMARDEPLAGMSLRGQGTGGSGGSLPGSSGNGQGFGYSIGGAADSESSYLIEGQDTENISGGYSKANVPMDFIQEVQMKTSGVEAEYGGALGGVVNVVMKKGSNDWHGSIFGVYDSSALSANDINAYLRYSATVQSTAPRTDPPYEIYQPQKDHFRLAEPGIVIGGPIYRDRLWFAAGFQPQINSRSRYVDFGSQDNNAGVQYFTQDRQQYYGYARLDAALTKKIRVFGSWLYQYAREQGASLPTADPIRQQSGLENTAILSPLGRYTHGIGWSAPNSTFNVGADITLTQHVVSTTRYGYFFDNYHDFGWPTNLPDIEWDSAGTGVADNTGAPLPAALQADRGTQTTPYNSSYTLFNADKHYQFNQDFAIYKGGWWGTHNFKFGYQLNHLVNMISQNGNVPYAFIDLGPDASYSPLTDSGGSNCDALTAVWGNCAGQYGYLTVQDFSTILAAPASDWNHAFYVQDAWTPGKGLTLDLGLRVEKEDLPAPAGVKVPAIHFSWSDKIEPRLGIAWDPTGKGKMKLFGSYGVINDVMKLLLAQTSWGAQSYEQCAYPLGPNGSGGFNITDLTLVFKNNRACPNGPATTQANFSGPVPSNLTDPTSGVSIIENVNYRPWEPVAPNVKPYRQHEYVAGFDFQVTPRVAFEVRYDRRRLDHVIEDASLSDTVWGEEFAVVNPGEGVNRTIDSFAAYLGSIGEAFGVPGQTFDAAAFGTCPSCPPNRKAIRNYDGIEFRLMMSPAHGFSGMFSYTYSNLWGNYTGLTTTDQSDGGTTGTGRNSPDTTRAFDEPFYNFGENGKPNDGRLPTDRPNVAKGYMYYTLPWWHQATTLGIFQNFLQGTPLASYIDVGGATTGQPYDAVYPWGRDKWVNATADAAGNITFSAPFTKRTPWYIQTDLNASHEVKITERKSFSFEATAINAFNQRAQAAFTGSIDSWQFPVSIRPGGQRISGGAPAYLAYESGYNTQALANARSVVLNSQYGKPFLFQYGRVLRLGVHYNF